MKERLGGSIKAKMWRNNCFITLCAFAAFNDLIFCYVKAIDSEHKCITSNKKLAKTYIYTRTATDVCYLIDIIISTYGQGHRRWRNRRLRTLRVVCTLAHIYVSLPIAQILVSGANTILDSSIFLFLIALQYTIRIYCIYRSLRRRLIIDMIERWLGPILRLVPFILASHLFGALWYFLATQRLMNCWASTRGQVFGSDFLYSTPANFLACSESNHTKTYPEGSNISHWDDLCPMKQADPSTYDFGIFFYALQSQVVSSTHPLLRRIFQSFWWALRNLSSLGSNLNSSMDLSETFFSVLISASGMVLFSVYLNARMQESQDRLKKLILNETRKKLMQPSIRMWLHKNDLPRDIESVILDNVHKLKETSGDDLNVQNILSILPILCKRRIKLLLCLPSLKQVPMLLNKNEQLLREICWHLMPVTYTEGSYIVQEGQPLGKMLLITQGIAVTYANGETSSGSSDNKWLKKGNFCGEELLICALKGPSFSNLPFSTRTVLCSEKVEAFALPVSDLKSIVSKFWWHFTRELDIAELEQWETLAASSIQAAWRRRAPLYYWARHSSHRFTLV